MAVDDTAIGAVAAAAPEYVRPQKAWWHGVLKFARKKPLGAVGFTMAGVLFFMTLGTPTGVAVPSLPNTPFGITMDSPWMERYGVEDNFYNEAGRLRIYEGPSSAHWLGTDKNGRDVWARVVNGARRSLWVGIWALLIATAIGTTIGVTSGYFGGHADTVSQRFMDALQAFPPLIALILIVTIQPFTDGPSLTLAAFALGIVGVAAVQRIVRGVVLSTKEQQYVEASRVIGATNIRTMRYHILPNIMASIIIVFSTGLGTVILAEAALSFIVPDKMPQGASWGQMLADTYPVIANEPWPGVSAAVAIALGVLAFNLAGDALRDVLDPRLRS
jgi:peptide/nickel transport system permease protein